MTTTRAPTMAEYQALTAAQDAIARLKLRGATVTIKRGLETLVLAIRFERDAGPVGYVETFDGTDSAPLACYQAAAEWLEKVETDALGVPTPVEVARWKRQELDAVQRLMVERTDRRLLDIKITPSDGRPGYTVFGAWHSLEWAYLHRVFMWPDTGQGSLNRNQRRAMKAQGRV